MKALSLRQPWASLIAERRKTIETRRWRTNHRGPLLICSTKLPRVANLPLGKAVCVVDLADCRRMRPIDEVEARAPYRADFWSWLIEDARPVEPFEVRGYRRLYEVDDDLVFEALDCRNCNGISRECGIDGLCVFDMAAANAG